MTKFDQLYDCAEGNFGLVTFAQAKSIGVSIRELDRWVKGGRLEKPARGLYRVVRFPSSEWDAYAIAVESIGADAYIYGESVLGMLHLAPTNPTWIYVALPRRTRRRSGGAIRVVEDRSELSHTNYNGVRSQCVVDAIRSCRTTVRPDRRLQAADAGHRDGYLTKEERDKLVREIKHETTA